jgi:hypothetical protein
LGGVDHANNITDAINQSRKVVVVMSPNLLNELWSRTAIEMTHTLDVNKLIFIMFQDLSMGNLPNEGMPGILPHLLETRTTLKWSPNPLVQRVCWQGLVRALYAK